MRDDSDDGADGGTDWVIAGIGVVMFLMGAGVMGFAVRSALDGVIDIRPEYSPPSSAVWVTAADAPVVVYGIVFALMVLGVGSMVMGWRMIRHSRPPAATGVD